jgi:hypothetical protein
VDITFMGQFAGFYMFGLFVVVYLVFKPRAKGLFSGFGYIFTPAGATRVTASTVMVQSAVAIVGGVWQRLTDSPMRVTARFSLDLPQSAGTNDARILSGFADKGFVIANGISEQARLYLSIEFAANTLVWVAVSWVVYRIATAVMKGEGFLGSMPRDLRVLALVILVTQTLSQYFGSRADSQVSTELFGANDWASNLPHAYNVMSLPLWQVFAATAIWVFAKLIENGVQLQRDNAGLI